MDPILATSRDRTSRVEILAVLPPDILGSDHRLVGLRVLRGPLTVKIGTWMISGAVDARVPNGDDLVDLPPPEQLERLVGRGLTTDMLVEPLHSHPPAEKRILDYGFGLRVDATGPAEASSGWPPSEPEPEAVARFRHELEAKERAAAAHTAAQLAAACAAARREIFTGWAAAFMRDVGRLAACPKVELGASDLLMLVNLLRDAGYVRKD